jgi:excinuclease ABC subunit C
MRKVGVPDEEVVGAFISQFYGENGPSAHSIPDEVLTPVLPESATGIREWLSERRGKKVALLLPKRGPRAKLIELANDNASHAFSEKRRSLEGVSDRLEDIQRRLRLPTLPRMVECLDISHLGGKDTSGGLVRMVDGEFDKSGYRSFHVKSVAEGDDYGAIYEVLSRRFRRALQQEGEVKEEGSGWEIPDLLVVDGGRGQLHAALKAARDLGLHDLAVVGLAKEREKVTGEVEVDRIYLPGQKNGIGIRPHTALVLLARLRDEAHRFANSIRKKQGKSHRLRSELESVPSLGPVTRKRLLSDIGGPIQIREASDEALLAVKGVTRRQVEALRKVFGKEES